MGLLTEYVKAGMARWTLELGSVAREHGLLNTACSEWSLSMHHTDTIESKGFDITFGPFLPCDSALCHPSRGVRRALLGGHAYGMLIGTCNPMA